MNTNTKSTEETEKCLPKIQIPSSIEEKLNYFIETNEIPHIIFHGSSGTGKKTIVYDFLNRIYKNDKHKIKSNVMIVNCAHGKGIKFIREELKFFAKKNIQANSEVLFKTIVLVNADFLTIDAQSALRRCIEVFSYNTRFFIIVENKYKLLNPILSRFCEIYIPETVVNGKMIYLHQYRMSQSIPENTALETYITQYVKEKMDSLFPLGSGAKYQSISTEPTKPATDTNGVLASSMHDRFVDVAEDFYEKAISCLDVMKYIETSPPWSMYDRINILTHFHKIKSEYRCEKLLIFYMLDYIESISNQK